MIPRPPKPVVVALDLSDLDQAEALAAAVASEVGFLKVGLELGWAHGPAAVRRIAAHGPVFVDAKLHDIPTTVSRATANIAELGVGMVTVHALGGAAMMQAALDGAHTGAERAGVPPPMVVAVTVLSSQSGEELASPASLAWEAQQAGLGGVVVSGEDVRDVRETCGEELCIVVPGIRPHGANGDDQVRVLTPAAALARGADYLVVGRPITQSPDPIGALRGVVLETR